MSGPERKRSSVATLLILAAIDMLTASLVCAVVLFLVLVGSQSEDAMATAGTDRFNAPSLAFVYFHGGQAPKVSNQKAAPLESTSQETPALHALLGAGPYALQTYRIEAGNHQFTLESAPGPTLIEIYPGDGDPLKLVVACNGIRGKLTVTFNRHHQVDGQCSPLGAVPTVVYPQGSHIQFVQHVDQAFPKIGADYWASEPPTAVPDGGRLFTLKAKKDASNAPLGPSGQIAEVLP